MVCAPEIRLFLSLDERAPEQNMISPRKQRVALFVERSSHQWIVQDPEGNFWLLPSAENPWSERQPFQPTEETELEVVPGHYKYMLGLPF
jgi:hypothetical protein